MSTAKDQIFAIFRNTKWLAAVSIFFVVLLYWPAQVRELYRVILADRNALDFVQFYLPLLGIAFSIWFGTNQIAIESTVRFDVAPTRASEIFARWWPISLGALPLIASAGGQFISIPIRFDEANTRLQELYNSPGSAFENFDAELAKTVGEGLRVSTFFTLILAVAFLFVAWGVSRRFEGQLKGAAGTYFLQCRFLGLTVVGIGILILVFFLDPVVTPQVIGVFGLMALFGLCVVAFTIQTSLATIHLRFPIFPVLFVFVLALSIADWNDNHQIRLIDKPPAVSGLDTVTAEFGRWFENRDDRGQFPNEYPVYIVAAQGGGIYAAYQTAVFLARMQDECPSFRKHLFAISSVSGGSIGASVFASALDAINLTGATETACPAIAKYLTREVALDSDQPKRVEQYVREVLSPKNDFLSPLVAATLFGDFTQRFLPVPISAFDRAKALESALEQAVKNGANESLLAKEYMSHWSAAKNLPALLLNTTDAASGRRVLFAPFTIGSSAGSAIDSLVPFQSLRASAPGPNKSYPLNLRLSTAAFVSARFPWVSPAATVPATEIPADSSAKMRLVDGGYFDNSGADTALDLIQALAGKVNQINNEADNQRVDLPGQNFPRVALKLIALGGGKYPVRDSFALGESMEPIRTLLSTRESRAYIAINRAARTLPSKETVIRVGETAETITIKDMRIAALANPFYDLPLGWAMSLRTREIIARQSGRYWDCEPENDFTQSSETSGSAADCVQLLIAHELNGTLSSAVKELAIESHYEGRSDPRPLPPSRLDRAAIVRCFAKQTNPAIRLPQARVLGRLLQEWDFYPRLKDKRMLAYVLGTAAHETRNFRIFSESLNYTSPERIYQVFGQRISQAQGAQAIEDAKVYVNSPERLANKVYGNRADLGNVKAGDGWLYRGRGILRLTGRDDYRGHGKTIKEPLEEEPDLLYNREVGARVLFSHFFPPAPRPNRLASYFTGAAENWIEARKAVPGGSKGDEPSDVAAESKKFLECLN